MTNWFLSDQVAKQSPRETTAKGGANSLSPTSNKAQKMTLKILLLVSKSTQSFTNHIVSEKGGYWVSKYDPVYTFSRNGQAISRVYIMEKGSLAAIKDGGF